MSTFANSAVHPQLLIVVLSNSEQLTWINEQYKPLLIKAFAFQKGEVIFLALLSVSFELKVEG